VSILQELAALGIPEQCIERRSSAAERGRRFSIHPQPEDEIWRVHVDGCWLQGSDEKRVDYVFWGQSASGRRSVLLVELKGRDFGKALAQIESTLQCLCKRSGDDLVHATMRPSSPGHDPPARGGVRAFVVLSKGRGVPQRTVERRKLQQRYGVIVYPYGRMLQVDGLDALPG
jgi:hypothetical protein